MENHADPELLRNSYQWGKTVYLQDCAYDWNKEDQTKSCQLSMSYLRTSVEVMNL